MVIFHPPRAKYLCESQLFCSVLTRSDACRLHRVALPHPRNHSSRPFRQVAEGQPRQRLAARRQHLSGGGASPSEPRRAGSHVATGGREFQTRADLATVAILHTRVAAGKTILLQRVAGLEEGSPLTKLARRAQRLHSVQVLAQQLVGLVVVVVAAKEGVRLLLVGRQQEVQVYLELHRCSYFHPPRAKYLCKRQLFCSVLTRSDACRAQY